MNSVCNRLTATSRHESFNNIEHFSQRSSVIEIGYMTRLPIICSIAFIVIFFTFCFPRFHDMFVLCYVVSFYSNVSIHRQQVQISSCFFFPTTCFIKLFGRKLRQVSYGPLQEAQKEEMKMKFLCSCCWENCSVIEKSFWFYYSSKLHYDECKLMIIFTLDIIHFNMRFLTPF